MAAQRDDLLMALLERGGFATLQLSGLHGVPQLRFVHPEQVRQVKSARLSNGTIIACQAVASQR